MDNIKNAVISFVIKRYGITIEDFIFYMVKNNYQKLTKDNEPTNLFYEIRQGTSDCYYYSLKKLKRLYEDN